MAIDLAPELLDILACPNCHGSLAVDHDRDELVCLAADCGLAYPVRQGIPVLLIDEARRPGPDLPVGSASSAASASPVSTGETSATSAPATGSSATGSSATGSSTGTAGDAAGSGRTSSSGPSTSSSASASSEEPASGPSAGDGERP